MSNSVLYDAPGPKARARGVVYNVVAGIAVAGGLTWLVWILAADRVTANGSVLPGLFAPGRWDIFSDPILWQAIGEGVLNTLRAAGLAAVIAVALGVVFALLTSARLAWVRVPTLVLIEFFRGMPVLLMMLFFLLIIFVGAPFWAVVAALAVYNGALIGEILRAGLRSLPKGQREAGLSIGLGSLRTRMLIEFPQAFTQMTPIIVAQLVVLLKDTSLGYIVSYLEVTRMTMNRLTNFYGNQYMFSFFFITLAIYLVINLLVSWFARYLSRRLTAAKKISGSAVDPLAVVTDMQGGRAV